MILRLGFGVLGCAALTGALVIACSSDSTVTPTNTPDAGNIGDASNTTDSCATCGNVDSGVGEPITTATANAWTWVDFPDSACGNGSPTGIALNLGTSKDLLIYLEGGGACWEATTCFGGPTTGGTPTANDLDGFDSAKFNLKIATKTGSALDRTVADNPFKDANIVYVPYCTGDVHAGDLVQTYPNAPGGQTITHYGRKNLEAFLKRVVPTFNDATRVTLGGSSAGGFGSAINYERVRQAFGGKTRVDMVDDCGPPFPNADITYYSLWASSWDLATAYPTGCTGCQTDITQLVPYLSKTYTDARFALLEYTNDPTIRQFFAITSPTDFRTDLEGVFTAQFDPTTNAKYFEVEGNLHTMFGYDGDEIDTTISPPTTGESVAKWLTDMETDSATWASVKAPPAAH